MAKVNLNHKLFRQAQKYLVSGVNSPVRAFNYVGGNPILIKGGKGAKVYDYDGREYIDYVLSWGSLILGHAFKQVVDTVKDAANDGLSFGTTHKSEIELAKLIHNAIPYAEKIRFVSSGTEAVMGSVRLARGFTGRNKIVKFEHSYHGHADYLLAKAGSGLATLGIPQSPGVPRDFIKHTIVVPYGDSERLEKIFERFGNDIAAVLVEPVGGNYGVIPPDEVFLRYLRNITKKYGALLIADEVITAFRCALGSYLYSLGIKPDLICLGKIIGGGLPVGAYAGRSEIMNYLAPKGDIYQASTFSGNPVVMQAGIMTLKTLTAFKKFQKWPEQLTEYLALSIKQKARELNIDLQVDYFSSMFSIKFKNKNTFAKFYRKLLNLGIYFAPSEFEANFLSFEHSTKDIKKTIDKVTLALISIKE